MQITSVGEYPHIFANISVLVWLPITSEKTGSDQALGPKLGPRSRVSTNASPALRPQNDNIPYAVMAY